MLLTGELEVFRVQDLLGLVGRKPGQWLITLRGGPRGHEAFIAMRDHAVVSVSADTSRQDLARRLVIEGAVGTTGLAEALRQASETGLGLVRALVDSDKVEPAVIPPAVRAHVVSALASLTHWRTGTFEVDMARAVPDDVDVTVGLAELGTHVAGLLRRWRPASDLLGGPHTVMSAYPGQVPERLRGLHSLIDGHRTVAELVDASGHGDIGTVVDLADLVEAGAATALSGSMGALEQRLAMLAAVEHPVPAAHQPSRRQQPNLSLIPGGAQEAAPVAQEADDLLSVILKGVRGV
jgi:hypothetical protein